jgi:PAS domain S-box-containing protein
MGMEGSAGSEVLRMRHHLLDTIQVALVLTDVHSKILYTNRQVENLFGYDREEIEGQRIRLLFLDDDLLFFLPNILYMTLYQEGFDGEALLRTKDGSNVFVRLVTSLFKEEGETFLTFSIHEIQHLKKLEKERLEGERWESLGRMVEEIAHQVRNPIVSIGGYTKRLQRNFPPSAKNQSYLGQILQETKKLETMVRRVEEYIHVPKPVYKREVVEEVVETALRLFSEETPAKEVSFNIETTGLKEKGLLFIDKELVTRALSQILKNSLEAMSIPPLKKKKMTVGIALFEKDEGIAIAISDKGAGIARRDQDLIFEPFFSTRPDHVGLGLTLVRRIIEEHGGKVRVESRLKKGTTVTLYFPKDRRRKIRRELLFPEARRKGQE